jgi:bifunctional enzyme CysN/CysC
LERKLFDAGRAATVLDGQNMRLGISKDLGFSATERSENLRRSAEVARLMNDAGLICLAAFVAPEEAVRQRVAETIGPERFLVVHLSAPLEVCRQRDTDGLYQQADAGQLTDVPGVSAPYEPPAAPDLVLPTHEIGVEECVRRVLKLLEARGVMA